MVTSVDLHFKCLVGEIRIFTSTTIIFREFKMTKFFAHPDFLRVVDCPRDLVPMKVEAEYGWGLGILWPHSHQGDQVGRIPVQLDPEEKVVLPNRTFTHQMSVKGK